MEQADLEAAADFVTSREDVEASILRIGLNNTQVVLIAADGEWLRFVVKSPEAAASMCERLKIEAHDSFPEHLRVKIGAYRRDPADWAKAPYPEQSRNTST
jgi:hypothetical protein